MHLLLLSGVALAAPLGLDPALPPRALDDGRWAFPHADGLAESHLDVLPQVVLHLDPGVAPPPGARSLGGRSWVLSVASPADAVQQALRLDAAPGVLAFPDVVLPLAPTQATPGADDPGRGGQWYLDALDYDQLLDVSIGDASTRVAVIDSGIDLTHPDLATAYDAPYDAWDDDDDPSPNPGEYCPGSSLDICDEHGTAVSGVVAARADNGAGIVGLCPGCTLIPIKLLGEGATTNSLSVDIRAFEHAIAQDVAVINNSWGFVDPTPVPSTLAAVIDRAATEPRGGLGALVVFAAGNDDREISDDELQALDSVLCVSATNSYGSPTNYTNYGATVDVAAPSATVTIAPGDQIIDNFGGTSGAAPVAAGLAAWAASQAPDLTAQELMALMIDTAVPSPLVTADDNGHHDIYGYGEIDALAVMAAVAAADSGLAVDEPGGCGCAGGPPAPGWLALFLPLAAIRRTR